MRNKTKDLKNLKWANLNLIDNAVEIEILNKMTNNLHFPFNLSWENCETFFELKNHFMLKFQNLS